MTLNQNSFDSRLRALETIRDSIERVKPLLTTEEGAEDFYGDFIIESGGIDMTLNRAPGEPWEAFQERLNALAFETQPGPLRLLLCFPKHIEEMETENAKRTNGKIN